MGRLLLLGPRPHSVIPAALRQRRPAMPHHLAAGQRSRAEASSANGAATAFGGVMKHWITAGLIAAGAIMTAPASAQDFPSKLIRIIVPFTPGGSNDVLARELATGFQARW